MPHELQHKHGLIIASLRYQCPCDNQEIIAIQVCFEPRTWEDENLFLDLMRSARRDMITEIRQHTNKPRT